MSKSDKSTLEEAADKVNDAVEEIALKAADAAIEPDPNQVAGTSNEQVYLPEAGEGIPIRDPEPHSPIKKTAKKVRVDR
jgi:hypothetical protein